MRSEAASCCLGLRRVSLAGVTSQALHHQLTACSVVCTIQPVGKAQGMLLAIKAARKREEQGEMAGFNGQR